VGGGDGFYENAGGETTFNFSPGDEIHISDAFTDHRFALKLYGKTAYSIGGTITITGAGGAYSLKLASTNPTTTQTQTFGAGAFTFTTPLLAGSDWTVTVNSAPPGQGCTVTNGSGSNLAANVGNVSVGCGALLTVTAAAPDGHGTITPPSQMVIDGSSASFTVTPNPGFEVASVTGDTCTITQQSAFAPWTSSPITQPCAVTAKFVDSPSQCSGTANFNPSFFDDFQGSSLDPSHWSVNPNSGVISVANNSVSLGDLSGFPYVTSVGTPIPSGGSISVRWIATYNNHDGADGDGTLVISLGLPSDNASDDTSLHRADAWQDSVNGFQVHARRTDAIALYPVVNDYPPTLGAMHEIEWCYLADWIEVWADGSRVFLAPNTLTRPDSLWFGSPVHDPSGVWNPFTLYYVEVRALNDEIFHDGFGN
jgi:hypothetical protein